MKRTFLTIAIVLLGQMAAAEVKSPAWVCSMNFSGKSQGVQVILGKTTLQGKGTINRLGVLGQTQVIPVNIEMKSALLSPTISLKKMEVYGEALNISLFNVEPMNILGNYIVAQADASLMVGVGSFLAVQTSFPDLNFRVGVQFNKGLGIHVGVQKMTVSLDETRL